MSVKINLLASRMMSLSTLTPVRVRGKKRSSKKPPLHQSGDMEETTKCTRTALSRLEQLPTELLQEIFLLSLNFNLPTASPYLNAALSSFQIKYTVVVHVFSSEATNQDDRALRSSLLRRKWMTWLFLRNCQRVYMLRAATEAFREAAVASSRIVENMAIKEMGKAFDRYFCSNDFKQRHVNSKTAPDESSSSAGMPFSWKGEDDKYFAVDLWQGGRILRIISPELEHEDNKSNGSQAKAPLERRIIYFPESLDDCLIPEKLLHGPWTQEKGDFLMFLLDRHAKIDWVYSTIGEAATRGLEDAIRECCLPAVTALVSSNWVPDSPRMNLVYEDELYEIDNNDKAAIKAKDPLRKWNVMMNTLTRPTAIGIIPTTKHLKMAISAPSGPKAAIIHVLCQAFKTEIDPDDPDIIRWALEHMAEGDESSGGPPTAMQHRSADGQLIDKWTVSGQTVLADLEHVRARRRGDLIPRVY